MPVLFLFPKATMTVLCMPNVQGRLEVATLLTCNAALAATLLVVHLTVQVGSGRADLSSPAAAFAADDAAAQNVSGALPAGSGASEGSSGSALPWRRAVGFRTGPQLMRGMRRVALLVVGTFLLSPLLQVRCGAVLVAIQAPWPGWTPHQAVTPHPAALGRVHAPQAGSFGHKCAPQLVGCSC